ncbi:MAG TPA: hypothetical protein PKK72_09030 [Chitinophagales bacterium]|nr:hypothetical protein [Chitinophagales bacterium]HNE46594.1 hypothetical protein [Chitinophagales bacterium]HNJ90220.1 hypothetical protein [Chitinophagales bacterium]HNK98198.1 hypothetical protein [Chitinophagales bacterium]HNM08717.1 hypothetical protein [Chitinophagales bacterium]
MRNIDTTKVSWLRSLRHLMLVVCMLAVVSVNAQVSAYGFSSFTGTFT